MSTDLELVMLLYIVFDFLWKELFTFYSHFPLLAIYISENWTLIYITLHLFLFSVLPNLFTNTIFFMMLPAGVECTGRYYGFIDAMEPVLPLMGLLYQSKNKGRLGWALDQRSSLFSSPRSIDGAERERRIEQSTPSTVPLPFPLAL
jgi:hypothetical protein